MDALDIDPANEGVGTYRGRGRRFRLMYEALCAIASGRIKDPMQTAAAAIKAVDPTAIIPQGSTPDLDSSIPVASRSKPGLVEAMPSEAQMENLFALAEQTAGRIDIPQPVLNYLYNASRWPTPSRSAWEKDVRTACSIDKLLRPTLKVQAAGELEKLVDREIKRSAFEQLKSSKGTLLLTFHGAFVIVARKLFAEAMPEGDALERGGITSTRENPGAALFTALRALQNGRCVLMAVDGPDGKRTTKLKVLGTEMPAGDGAAFLAHTTSCETAWYTVVRKDNLFVPLIEPGPSRSSGEKLGDFRSRLYDFCAKKIENVLTGDPGNIALRPSWVRVLTRAS